MSSDPDPLPSDLEKARAEIERLQRENEGLRQRLGETISDAAAPYHAHSDELPLEIRALPAITNESPVREKINLFRSLFRGREDVFAIRWTNERTGKSGYSPACEDPWSLRKGQPRKFLPLTDQVVHDHLAGNKIIGIFPLLKDDTCCFLACDFDKDGWKLDAMAYLEACRLNRVPAYLERSRSGNGAHTWVFFSSPVSAIQARQLGMRLLRQAMDARGDMDLGSYDRFFPNQDFVPRGGFGNLIAAPLQKKSRALGNSEFLDISSQNMNSWPDQWAFLSGIQRLTVPQLEALLEIIPSVAVGLGKTPRPTPTLRARHPAPKRVRCAFGAAFSVEKSGIPRGCFPRSNILPPSITRSSTRTRSSAAPTTRPRALSSVIGRTSVTSICLAVRLKKSAPLLKAQAANWPARIIGGFLRQSRSNSSAR